MTHQSDIYVDKLIPTNPERIARATMVMQTELAQNAGFVRFLQMPDAAGMSLGGAEETMAAFQEEAQNKSIPEVLTPSKTKKSESAVAPVPGTSSAEQTMMPDEVSKELKDTEAMWTMDLTGLTAEDFKILQNLPVPSSAIQGAMAQACFQNNQGMAGDGTHYQGLGVSKGLQTMLEKAYKTQKPIRIDIAENASIILRLCKSGRVSAEFLPGDQVAEIFYRQNLHELKSRLESKQLPVGEFHVRSYKEREDKRQQHESSG